MFVRIRIQTCSVLMAVTLLCISCKRDYAEIETYIEERPDSAWTVLCEQDKPWALFPSRRARYELLSAWSLERIGIDDGSLLSEMAHSAAWYEIHGSSRYWMLSQFFLGDQLYDSGDDIGAIARFRAAYDLAESRKDWLFAGRASMKMADILRLNSCGEALTLYSSAARAFDRAEKTDEADKARYQASIPIEKSGVCAPHFLRTALFHRISPEECEARSETAIVKTFFHRTLIAGSGIILFLAILLIVVLFKRKDQQLVVANLTAQAAQERLEGLMSDQSPAVRALAERFERVCKVDSTKSSEQFESVLYELRNDKLFHKELLSEIFRLKPDTHVKYKDVLPSLKEEEQVLLLYVLAGMPRPVLARIFGTSLKSMYKRIERLSKKIDKEFI